MYLLAVIAVCVRVWLSGVRALAVIALVLVFQLLGCTRNAREVLSDLQVGTERSSCSELRGFMMKHLSARFRDR